MVRSKRRAGMRRRDFITGIAGSGATWPLVARTQQAERVRRIGVLMAYAESDLEAQAWVAVFRDGLRKLGRMEGRNISLDIRWATGERVGIERSREQE